MYDARTHYNRSGIPVAIIRFHCRSCPPKCMLINTSGVRNSPYENADRSSCPLQLCFSLLQLFFNCFVYGQRFSQQVFIEKSLNLQLKCVRAFTTEPFGIASESGGRLMFSPEYKMHFLDLLSQMAALVIYQKRSLTIRIGVYMHDMCSLFE